MELLFHKRGALSEYLSRRHAAGMSDVEGTDADYLLKVSENDFCQHMWDKHTIEAPLLRIDAMYASEPVETDIDISQHPERIVYDRSRPFYVKGTQVTVVIPIEGETELFDYRPSSFTFNPPWGKVRNGELHLVYNLLEEDHANLAGSYRRDVERIEEYLVWVKADVASYNATLEPAIRARVAARKNRLMANMNLASGLGIPIKRRDGASPNYTVPDIRKKPPIARPEVTPGKYKPEPVVEMVEYERILDITDHMVKVMEYSPGAFVTLDEEALRTHFLVQLNGQYEGRATGETFNYNGKTDILIREAGRNVFIAECKFWRGDNSFRKTIDQLLSYTSWRDTKTAILVFNRNKELSAVLQKVPTLLKEHACFKRDLERRNETSFRCVFHQPDDENREIVLTVMVFNVPAP